MRAAAIGHLELWLRETADPDPEQRRWKRAHAEGAVLAYERVGVLSGEEATRWRARVAELSAGRRGETEPPLPDRARAAAADHLARLVGRVPPLRRNPEPEDIAGGMEAWSAIETLHAVGALDEREYAEWRSRLLAAQAPWLEDPVLPEPDSSFAIAIPVPAETEEEAAQDAAAEAAWEARPKATTTRMVVIGSPERHAGLAMVALVAHEDATGLHFHYLGAPQSSDLSGRESMRSFEDSLNALPAPTLHDDRGGVYDPVQARPVSATGQGGIPDAERREVITGAWLYTPAAPDDATTFYVEQAGERWTLRSGR